MCVCVCVVFVPFSYVLFHNTSVPTLLARIVGIIGMIPSYMIYRSQNAPDHFTPDGQLFDMRPNEPCCSRRGKRYVVSPLTFCTTRRVVVLHLSVVLSSCGFGLHLFPSFVDDYINKLLLCPQNPSSAP